MFDSNRGRLNDTFLGANEVSIAKGALSIEGKNTRELTLFLLKTNNMYSLDVFIPNKLGLFLIILDSTSSYFWDP